MLLGNEAPILQKLGIESLAEKYSAKIREQDKRLKRHHHRRRDDNRRGSQKYRRRSHSKSRLLYYQFFPKHKDFTKFDDKYLAQKLSTENKVPGRQHCCNITL